jgi:hypothetical protein
MYRELFNEVNSIKSKESDKFFSELHIHEITEASNVDTAKLRKDALAYISQTLLSNPGIMHLNMREHIREDRSLCYDIEKYSFEAAKSAILEIYNSDYLSQEEKREFKHILDDISRPSVAPL